MRGVGLALAALAMCAAPAAARRASAHVSVAGITATMPAGWRPHGDQDKALLYLSPGPGEEGVIIARHQAMIVVVPLEDWRPGDDLKRVIETRLGEDRVTARRGLRLKGAGDCTSVEEVDTASEVGPDTDQLNAGFYCVARGRAVLVQLTHWPRDPKRAAFRAAALDVVRSLTVRPLLR